MHTAYPGAAQEAGGHTDYHHTSSPYPGGRQDRCAPTAPGVKVGAREFREAHKALKGKEHRPQNRARQTGHPYREDGPHQIREYKIGN